MTIVKTEHNKDINLVHSDGESLSTSLCIRDGLFMYLKKWIDKKSKMQLTKCVIIRYAKS